MSTNEDRFDVKPATTTADSQADGTVAVNKNELAGAVRELSQACELLRLMRIDASDEHSVLQIEMLQGHANVALYDLTGQKF